MALLSKDGRYAKVIGVNYDKIHNNHSSQIAIFKDEDQRNRYDIQGGLNPNETVETTIFNTSGQIVEQFNKNASSVKTVQDNLLTAIYRAMKIELFSDWTDV